MSRQKKSLFKRGFLNFQKRMNYFFSSTWILNFGVVPLLRFCAFLLFPEPTSLRERLFSVTRVLETIFLPLQASLSQHFMLLSRRTLTSSAQAVKVCLLLFFSTPLVIASQNIILSHGEHKLLSVPGLVNFTNGNKDVLGHHHDSAKKTLLLKGQKLGFSEILVWKEDKSQETWRVYVLSKRQHLELYQLVQIFEDMELETHVNGLKVTLKGEITKLTDYQKIHGLKETHGDKLDLEVTLSKELDKTIKARVLRVFFDHYVDSIQCQTQSYQIECVYPADRSIPEKDLERLEKEWKVRFRNRLDESAHANYRVRLKLIQFEQTDGKELSLGLDGLNLTWGDLFQRNFRSIVESNLALLRSHRVEASTLAEPEALVKLGSQAKLKIGSEIPYTQTSQTGAMDTQWKFAGLEVEIELKRAGPHYEIVYTTGFTRPDSGSAVSGNRESSTILIPLDQPLTLFQIHFQSLGKRDTGFPVLKDIPLLGLLFGSSSDERTYKNLTGVIQIEKLSF